MERNLGQEINVYRWSKKPRNCQGVLSQDEDGFYIQGDVNYRIEKGNSVGINVRGNMRFYDVM